MDRQFKSSFDRKGYALAKSVFNKSEIKALEIEFDRIVSQLTNSAEDIDATWQGATIRHLAARDDLVVHTHNVHKYSAKWLRAMQHPNFLAFAREILGPDVILHHNKLFQKPAEHGSPFPMHQDWSYFPTIRDSMIAAIIHVSDATEEMGCLRVYEGSQTLGRKAGTSGQESEADQTLQDFPIENALPIEASAGDVLFFHYFTVHGSMPNRSTRTRKTVLVQMHAGDDRMEDSVDHPDEGLVLCGWNFHTSRNTAGNRARAASDRTDRNGICGESRARERHSRALD